MSRSIELPRERIGRASYFAIEHEEEDFDFLIECIQDNLRAKFKSLFAVDEWLEYPYRETRVILKNYQVKVCFSCYLGLCALTVVPIEEENALSQRNGGFISEYIDLIYGEYRLVATASNGESFYEKV